MREKILTPHFTLLTEFDVFQFPRGEEEGNRQRQQSSNPRKRSGKARAEESVPIDEEDGDENPHDQLSQIFSP